MAFSNTDYKSRLEMIRRPEYNHMSRTKTRADRFKKRDGTSAGRKKKKLYAGAYVAEVRRQIPSGFRVAGNLLQHLHAFIIDMDLTSLYPSIMLLLNLFPKTFVAKFIFAGKIEIPKYDYIKFIDKEEEKEYKCNANDFLFECLTGKHWWAIMEIFCKMPSTGRILSYIEDHMAEFQ